MTTHYIVVTTKSKSVAETIHDILNGIDDTDMKIETHEQEDDPGAAPGKYLLWYLSESHNKIRYYVAPPPGPFQKPIWSYDKKDAATLSKEACVIVKDRMIKIGYKTPLEIDKGGPKLTVINGDVPDNVEEIKGPFADAELEEDTNIPDDTVGAFMRFYHTDEGKVNECVDKMEAAGLLDDITDYKIGPITQSINPTAPAHVCFEVSLTFDTQENYEKWKANVDCQKLYMEYAAPGIDGAKFVPLDSGAPVFDVGHSADSLKDMTLTVLSGAEVSLPVEEAKSAEIIPIKKGDDDA